MPQYDGETDSTHQGVRSNVTGSHGAVLLSFWQQIWIDQCQSNACSRFGSRGDNDFCTLLKVPQRANDSRYYSLQHEADDAPVGLEPKYECLSFEAWATSAFVLVAQVRSLPAPMHPSDEGHKVARPTRFRRPSETGDSRKDRTTFSIREDFGARRRRRLFSTRLHAVFGPALQTLVGCGRGIPKYFTTPKIFPKRIFNLHSKFFSTYKNICRESGPMANGVAQPSILLSPPQNFFSTYIKFFIPKILPPQNIFQKNFQPTNFFSIYKNICRESGPMANGVAQPSILHLSKYFNLHPKNF